MAQLCTTKHRLSNLCFSAGTGRRQAILAGKRNLGQQAQETTIQCADSSDETLSLLKKQLPTFLRRE
jgi:hypothetical protein